MPTNNKKKKKLTFCLSEIQTTVSCYEQTWNHNEGSSDYITTSICQWSIFVIYKSNRALPVHKFQASHMINIQNISLLHWLRTKANWLTYMSVHMWYAQKSIPIGSV